jgi:hypothetical protein
MFYHIHKLPLFFTAIFSIDRLWGASTPFTGFLVGFLYLKNIGLRYDDTSRAGNISGLASVFRKERISG